MTTIGHHRYWDGGLFSNTPLSPAINALEDVEEGSRSVEREIIVVELFPMNALIPRTFPEVLQRVLQLQYTSRLKLDSHVFDQMNDVVDLVTRIEDELPADSPIRTDTTFERLRDYRKIDHLNVVTSSLPSDLSNAS